METGLGALSQKNHMPELKQGSAEGSRMPPRHSECAQGTRRNGAAALNEKPGGLVKKSMKKE